MPLYEEQIIKYSRNMKLEGVGSEGQEKLLKARVLVIGAGGLGSPVIAYLAGAGIGTIGIADSDNIHLSNLNRQVLHNMKTLGMPKVKSAKKFIQKLNTDIKVKTYKIRVTIDNILELIEPYDYVVDCMDTLLLKFLLNDACVEAGKVLAHAGVVGYGGQITTIDSPKTACLRCLFPDTPECDYGPHSAEVGVLGAFTGVLGSMQAAEVVKHIVGLETLANKFLIYDGKQSSFKTMNIDKNPECIVCSSRKMLPKDQYLKTKTCRD